MCNLYTIEETLNAWAEDFERFLGERLTLSAGPDTLANQPWATTVYPKYQGLFFRPIEAANLAAGYEPAVGRWGVVPFFHKGPAKTWKFPTNNARSEEMATKASFRDAVKSRRCLVPATAICEWTGPQGRKTKHFFTRADGAPLFIAGLWARHAWEGETTESYTMVMINTAPGDDMHPFHNRQPVFLDRGGAKTWLDLDADYAPLLKGPSAGTLKADPPEPVAT
ncbi:MAG: SOS response-associated peptidase [Phenylobacterium sp.]|uniref:SOS response-associated peptidase n=1 Tax=Phenylobacterium sp. TaxID=1871053 RepID=UPI0025F0CB13|nr:SOS response-associated peptidase [Phenylobacterium sp.]MBI1198515.1 SOS response-associated peptidase [Phenylobacterium sp.]